VVVAQLAAGAFGVHVMTRLRGASNQKVKAVLGWTPMYTSWREGFAADFQGEPAAEGVTMHAERSGAGTWS